jgi:hypothetical protein
MSASSNPALDALRHNVSGKVASGQAVPIVAVEVATYPREIIGVTFANEAQAEAMLRDCERIVDNPHAFHASEVRGAREALPVLRAAAER